MKTKQYIQKAKKAINEFVCENLGHNFKEITKYRQYCPRCEATEVRHAGTNFEWIRLK